MSSLSLKTIDFHNQTLITFKKDDIIYTAVRPIVEAMGLEWSGQVKKLSNPKFSCVDMYTTGKDGKTYQMLCMPLRKLNGWLFSINPEKVRSDLKAKVIQYQEECFEVLFNYWNNGIAINPRLSSDDTLPLRNAVNLATGVLKLDYSTIYKMVHQRFGVDEIKELSREKIGQAVEYVHHLMLQSGHQGELKKAYHDKDVQFIMYYMPELFALIKHQVYPALRLIQSPLAGKLMGLATETAVHVNVLNRLALNDGILTLHHVQNHPVKI